MEAAGLRVGPLAACQTGSQSIGREVGFRARLGQLRAGYEIGVSAVKQRLAVLEGVREANQVRCAGEGTAGEPDGGVSGSGANRYSVPVRLIGPRVRVRVLLHASHLVVYDGSAEGARDERLMVKVGAWLELDHCLEALIRNWALCRVRPHSSRLGWRASSPGCTTRGGRQRGVPTATPRALGR